MQTTSSSIYLLIGLSIVAIVLGGALLAGNIFKSRKIVQRTATKRVISITTRRDGRSFTAYIHLGKDMVPGIWAVRVTKSTDYLLVTTEALQNTTLASFTERPARIRLGLEHNAYDAPAFTISKVRHELEEVRCRIMQPPPGVEVVYREKVLNQTGQLRNVLCELIDVLTIDEMPSLDA